MTFIYGGLAKESTAIDEPFAFKAADNYIQLKDPEYQVYGFIQLGCSSTEAIRGKEWEVSILYEMV